MTRAPPIAALFLDIGGVVLSDGWDRHARSRAAKAFHLNLPELEQLHHATFECYEIGKLTLDEYLSLVVFHRRRAFARAQFKRFMFAQSQAHPEMFALVAQIKRQHALRVAVVSNEGRELNAYRIRTFRLDELADCFVSSCFVHMRKPDADMFRLALDLVQVPAARVAYLEDTPMFVDIARTMGIRAVHHTDYRSTRAKLAALGLEVSRS